MNLGLVVRDNTTILEGTPAMRLMHAPEDAVDVIGACFEHGARSVLLYAENLTEGFFDLSTREAGEILQKLRNYHVRLAVVLPPGGTLGSARFREMVAEEREGGDFRIFEDREAALEWLVQK